VTVSVDNAAPPPVALTFTLGGVPPSPPRGDTFTARATAENTGGSTVTGHTVRVSWSPGSRLKLERPRSSTQSLGPIEPGTTESASWEIKADREGSVTVTFELLDDSGTVVAEESRSIDIREPRRRREDISAHRLRGLPIIQRPCRLSVEACETEPLQELDLPHSVDLLSFVHAQRSVHEHLDRAGQVVQTRGSAIPLGSSGRCPPRYSAAHPQQILHSLLRRPELHERRSEELDLRLAPGGHLPDERVLGRLAQAFIVAPEKVFQLGPQRGAGQGVESDPDERLQQTVGVEPIMDVSLHLPMPFVRGVLPGIGQRPPGFEASRRSRSKGKCPNPARPGRPGRSAGVVPSGRYLHPGSRGTRHSPRSSRFPGKRAHRASSRAEPDPGTRETVPTRAAGGTTSVQAFPPSP